jgi:TolB-like protein/Tfp pilus assembly protein PilF
MPADLSPDAQLELAHVLFIDIVGYSKRLINEQTALVKRLNELVLQTEQCRKADAVGKLIRIPTGDGVALAFFTSPDAPVRCAMELSKADQADPKLELRMGIHTGPVDQVSDVNRRSNIAGGGINMAQRVMECGDAGHILLSRHVAEDLEQYGHWQPLLHDLGPCEVKHGVRIDIANLYSDEVGNPELPKKFQTLKKHRSHVRWATAAIAVVVLAAIVAAFVFLLRRPTRSATAIVEKSIAVLPFANLSRDPDNAYFAEGVQDEILTRLSKIADLKVISRTSTQHYKSAPENLPEIARQLGVAHIVEGSVQKSADAVRVNVQLIKAANDSHLWADTYDRKLTDIFSVESEVAKAIAEQLRAKLTGQEEQVIAAQPTDNVEAYDAYLRGLAYSQKTATTPANSLAAQKYLKEAVRLDPKFALSWALLSYVDSVGYRTVTLPPTPALREEALQSADTALTLQPDLGEALIAKGYYHYSCLKDYETAVRYFEQARKVIPNSSRIPESLAFVARRQGDWDRSEAYFKEAEQLDPRNVAVLSQQALTYIVLRRFPDALRKLDQILNITPDDTDTLTAKAAIVQAEGDLPRAAALLAPLRPGADHPGALKTQVYQAILERRPEPIIPRLQEILAKPDPALGYRISEYRFWLGWAQEVAGDHANAKATWQEARSELESCLKDQPENGIVMLTLALTYMGLGDKPAALSMAEGLVAMNPIEKDALAGPQSIEFLARVAARVGEPDRAIAALQKVLSLPYNGLIGVPLTPALLRLDPMFDSLRNDPRFQKLCEGTK